MVATPLTWDEVNPKLDPARFTLRTVPDRLKQDPWRGFFETDQHLPDLVHHGDPVRFRSLQQNPPSHLVPRTTPSAGAGTDHPADRQLCS
jgi:hypothetical protein